MASILCIYGTTSGNTEMVAEKVVIVLNQNGHAATAQRVECTKIEDMDGYDLIILAAPTYGHGILQDHFLPFAAELKTIDLTGRKFTVIGLGDKKYDMAYHIESARTLEKIVKGGNGQMVVPPLRISGLPLPQLSGKVTEWAKALAEVMANF